MAVSSSPNMNITEDTIARMKAQKPSWQQTMLRITDPNASLTFYCQHFHMTLVHFYHFSDFSLFFLATLREADKGTARWPTGKPGTQEAHEWLWNMPFGQSVVELTWNHDAQEQERVVTDAAGRKQVFHSGNDDELFKGFGHIAFNTPDVYKASEQLEAAGVAFKKRPNEGRMQGLAFCLDPDGYWIEIVRRSETCEWPEQYNLSQTMLRIKDPAKSVPFYRDLFGMRAVWQKDFSDFSLFFFATTDEENPDSKTLWDPCLELTYNHGTEKEEGPTYHNGNDTKWKGKNAPRGFGHIGFVVENLEETCQLLESAGVEFVKKPQEGKMHSLAFAKDPDGWWIEVIQKNSPAFPASEPPAGFEFPKGVLE